MASEYRSRFPAKVVALCALHVGEILAVTMSITATQGPKRTATTTVVNSVAANGRLIEETTRHGRPQNVETMPEKLTLESICTTCGRPLREHCVSRDSRLWYRMCAAKLRAKDAERWGAETGLPDGEHCIQCGWHVQDHYHWAPVQVNVMGTLITPSDPCAIDRPETWLGCGPTED